MVVGGWVVFGISFDGFWVVIESQLDLETSCFASAGDTTRTADCSMLELGDSGGWVTYNRRRVCSSDSREEQGAFGDHWLEFPRRD